MASDVDPKDDEDRAGAVVRPTGAPALADETSDELPALLALAVGVAIIAVAIIWPTLGSGQQTAATETVETTSTTVEEATTTTEAEAVADLDLEPFRAELAARGIDGVTLSAEGAVVTATGEVADEATRAEVIQFLQDQPGVEAVIDELTIAEPAAQVNAEATITASQVSIALTGTVPDEATREALVARAATIYDEAQIDDQLTVDDTRAKPTQLTIAGSMSDEVLYNQVSAGFDDIEGVEVAAKPITLEASGELESSLNSLAPIQFASGSAQIDAASNAILDQAAEFLKADPTVAVEIGGHTDSVGDEQGNQSLSQLRAEAVKAALEERGVTNELSAVGFGETRLKEDPDDTPEKRAVNRRIEYRVIG